MKNQNEERRKGTEEMKQDISTIMTDIALMKNMVEQNHKSMRETTDRISNLVEKHNQTLYGNGMPGLTGKISEINKVDKAMKDHRGEDRWLHGTLITIMLFILGKMFYK